MADKEELFSETEEVTEEAYSPEELDKIKELTSFYDKGPGQVTIPDTEEPEISAPADEEEVSLDDLGLDDIGGTTEPEISAPADEEEVSLDDLGLDDIGGTTEPEISVPADEEEVSLDDLGLDDLGGTMEPALPSLDEQTPLSAESMPEPSYDIEPPSLDELSPSITSKSERESYDLSGDLSDMAKEHAQQEDISDEEFQLLRGLLREFPGGIRKAITDSILDNKLSNEDTRALVDKILDGGSSSDIKSFLEEKLKDKAGKIKEEGEKKPKVVLSRSQYTEAGLKRQAQLIKAVKYGLSAAIFLFIVGGSTYKFVIKPFLYKRIVNEGKILILNQAPEPKAIKEAEKLFEDALSYYPYRPYAFLQYADVYRKKGLYDLAFEKLFGKVKIKNLPLKYNDTNIKKSEEFWNLIKKVPSVRYESSNEKIVLINNVPWELEKKGAYLLKHLDKKEEDANLLLALGSFHSNPAKRFHENYYRNNLLGIDYFRRVLTFDVETPFLQEDKVISNAVMGIGDVYYNQKDYYRSLEYFDKIVKNDPVSISGHAGVIKSLLQIFRITGDPRLIIQQHSVIKHKYKIEEKLPLYIMAKLASFYIDLPADDKLRIKYNVNPIDHRTGKELKLRAKDLLDIIFKTSQEDEYGNEIDGKKFAEGFYQRGRYYRLVEKQLRMSLKQMEYAYKYDPKHYMAINDRAEILIELNDYHGAIEHLKMAMNLISEDKLKFLGDRPEDETLIEADIAKVPFNMGRAIYLNTIRDLKNTDDWLRIQEADKYQSSTDYGVKAISGILDKIDSYWDKTKEIGFRDEKSKAELFYYSGWSFYIRGNYRKALIEWESIDPAWQQKYLNIELAKSHALYHLGIRDNGKRKEYLNAALGYLHYLHRKYDNMASSVKNIAPSNNEHRRLFSRLAIIENNLGAIYEVMNNEKKSLQYYWNSIEHSKNILQENEVSHLNLKLSFKRKGLEDKEAYPLIMDFIPPTLLEENL